MRGTIRILLTLQIASVAAALANTGTWENLFRVAGGAGSTTAFATAVAADGQGNSYVTGHFEGTISLCNRSFTNVRGSDLFVAKFDPSGTCVWAQRASGPVALPADFALGAPPTAPISIALDENNNVVIAGTFLGAIGTFGPFQLQSPDGCTSGPCEQYDMFVAKLSGVDGTWLWARDSQTPISNPGEVFGSHVVVAPSGSIYVSGLYKNSLRFGSDQHTDRKQFIVKFNSAGTYQWSRAISGLFISGFALGNWTNTGRLAVGPAVQGTPPKAESLYLLGDYGVFGAIFEGPGAITLPGAGSGDIFTTDVYLARIDSDGTWMWARRIGSDAATDVPAGRGLTSDSDGNVYLSARTGNASTPYVVQVGSCSLTTTGTALVAKFDRDGACSGTVLSSAVLWAVSANPAGEVYVTGNLSTGNTFGPLAAPPGHSYLAKLDRSLQWQWVRSLGSSASQSPAAYGLAADSSYNVWMSGTFRGGASATCDEPCSISNPSFEILASGATDSLVYRNYDAYLIGERVIFPAGVVVEQPGIEIVETSPGATSGNSFFWSPFQSALYAVRTVRTQQAWRLSTDPLDGRRYIRRARGIWPTNYQRHVAGSPVELQPPGTARTFSQILFSETGAVVDATRTMQSNIAGFNVLLYLNGPVPDVTQHDPTLVVSQSFLWNDPRFLLDGQPCTMGTKLTGGALHSDPLGKNGFVFFERSHYDGVGGSRAYARETRTGTILPVNRDTSSLTDDMVVVWYQPNAATNVGWPVNPVRYNCTWPSSPPKIVVASELGSDVYSQPSLDPNVFRGKLIYNQPDPNLPGYNPNEEHALFTPSQLFIGRDALYALRNDLGLASGSEPYVLLKFIDDHGDGSPLNDEWAISVYQVLPTDATYTFSYSGVAGTSIRPPYPLTRLNPCQETSGTGIPFFKDYKAGFWGRSAGSVNVRYFYPLQPGFFYDLNRDGLADVGEGGCVPLLDRLPGGTPGTAVDAAYSFVWPTNPPRLLVGETLLSAKNGLPEIRNQAAAEIVFDELKNTNPTQLLAEIIDPLSPVFVPLAALPSSIGTRVDRGLRAFVTLPPDLEKRLFFDPINQRLIFEGFFDASGAGDPLVLLNVMTEAERLKIRALDNNSAFLAAVDALYHKTRNPRQLDLDNNGAPDQALLVGLQDADNDHVSEPFRTLGVPGALTAGGADGTGFMTLAFNNHSSLNPLPVSLSVIRVDCGPYQGQINVISPANVFDEKLTLRHSGDFGGDPSGLNFVWYSRPDEDGTSPTPLPDPATGQLNGWTQFDSGPGKVAITIEGASLQTLADHWFVTRYTGLTACSNATVPSQWAGSPGGTLLNPRAQLAEGWIKRVVNGLNPFEARVKDFHKAPTNTYASMLIQAGERYEGDIAFNGDPANLNSIGLLSAYETVLRRGQKLSIDASPPINFAPANNALLNAAGRISDFYVLLGNEAYADAADPTIGFGTSSGQYGTLAPSIFSFQNQVATLLDEELVLLRGRDDSNAPTAARPVYNRFFWNFTSGNGELAYSQGYNVTDQNSDGVINEFDARILFPQGHGDAWGHYLTATTTYYGLLRHPFYTWVPRAEAVLVAGVPIQIDLLDERKFAQSAAAKAKAGAEIVDLTYRRNYVEDPAGQWKGYKDSNADRGWGLTEWGRRAGQGAFFDWVTGNAILRDVDPDACSVLGLSPGSTIPASNPPRICHSGISRIDRTTVSDLDEIGSHYREIEDQLSKADSGLNPLGAARGVVPFDIDPALVTGGKTHFEQIYDRALQAVSGTVTVFNTVNQQTQMLRMNQDTLNGFRSNVDQRERDLQNRLIELFGYPYADDIGPAGTYPTGYSGPDLYHHMYVDSTELTGSAAPETTTFRGFYTKAPGIGHFIGDPDADPFAGGGAGVIKEVEFHLALDGLGLVKPPTWVGRRRAPGELQLALSEVYQNRALFEQALIEYSNHVAAIEGKAGDIEAQSGVNSETIRILDNQARTNRDLNISIGVMHGVELTLRRIAAGVEAFAGSAVEALPKSVGLAVDVTAPVRGIIKLNAAGVIIGLDSAADVALAAQTSMTLAKEDVALTANIALERVAGQAEIENLFGELEELIRHEPVIRLETFTRREAVEQSMARYLATLASGERLLEELIVFRKETAAQVQQYRYQDMAFRIFRNDAVQKYRAQFDLAARYTYLAATAYDYETNLLGTASGAGRNFLTNIVRQRGLGQIINGTPIAGSNGLADPLARMSQNFAVLKGQMGFNNPQTETNRFSLRSEMLRLRTTSDEDWRARLAGFRVADLWQIPEFRRYCRAFAPESAGPQPGLVIELHSNVTFGLNFFGFPLGGGDSAYDPTHFATKVRSVGVWLSNYNGTGLSNTPRVFLVPVGADVLRSPSGNLATREWNIIDQKIPTPFPVGASDLTNPGWIPLQDGLSDEFADVRRYSSFRAFHDSGAFNPAETVTDTRLIGRSVWNTRWLLIIPGGTLLNNANEGLDTLIYGPVIPGTANRDLSKAVSDIKMFFQTYAYSGN